MGYTYNAQPWNGERPTQTMSVGELIQVLQGFDPDLPVIFKSPTSGCFGANVSYSIDRADAAALAAGRRDYPGGERTDEDTGLPEKYEPWSVSWEDWNGVIIR